MGAAPRKAIDEGTLIMLVYSACFTHFIDKSGRPWDKPIGDNMPGELERDAYRLATELGLKPVGDVDSLDELKANLQRQLRTERHRDVVEIALLLVKQHGLMSFVQVHPNAPERAEVCFKLDEMKRELARLLTKYGLKASLEKLPQIPLPGVAEGWMDWSGDALKDAVIAELGAKPA